MSQGGQDAWGPGSVVASRFRLEDLLDERAGARFWRATDLTLARNVAIHVISAQDRRAHAVLTAARTSATVSEPHLLRVLDAVQEDDVVHVVHEWGTGMSLDRMVAEEPLDPRRAAWLVREVAQAIAATHAQGVAHGRLLPENVLVSDSGSVKLIGFVVDAVLYGRLSPQDLDGRHRGAAPQRPRERRAQPRRAALHRARGPLARAARPASCPTPRSTTARCAVPARCAPACPASSTRCAAACCAARRTPG